MRSSMIYSMLSTHIYNLTKNNECDPIFDIGSVFFEGDSDTGYKQKTAVGILLNGIKINKGFGIDKPINYDFYDIKAILELIANEFSMNIELNIKDMPFMEEGKSVEICYKNKVIGIMGELSTKAINNLENGKLVKGEVLYLELYLDDLEIGSTAIENVSKYPSILREYNFLVPKDEIYAEYVKEIRDLSDYITSVKVNDIYKGKGVKEGFVSVLLEIEYSSMDKTLLTEEVEEIENKMYTKLKNRNIELKM
jgi:phenylalanyl-tRNA synthetase beta chain